VNTTNSPGWSGYDNEINPTIRRSFEKETERLIEGHEKIKDNDII